MDEQFDEMWADGTPSTEEHSEFIMLYMPTSMKGSTELGQDE